MFAYEGPQIVPMAQPYICKWFLRFKIKLFSVSTDTKNVVITFVKTVHLEQFSKSLRHI